MPSVVPRTKTISRESAAFRKPPDRVARRLVRGGRVFAQAMHSTGVRVLLGVIARQAVDDQPRLLRGRRIVEIDERLAMDMALQNRKVAANRRDITRR